jgi:hypothetical protein
MRRVLTVWCLTAAVLALGLSAGPVRAGKGGFSSGGRSFSAPGGRSYSSGGGGRSFSVPAGRSYSSGGSRPVTPVPAGRSYSSGGSRPTTPVPAGRSCTSGRPTTVQPATPGKTSPSSTPSPGGRSYASGGSATPSGPAANGRPTSGFTSPGGKTYQSGAAGNSPAKPAGSQARVERFDSLAASAQAKQESRAKYVKGQAPRAEYQDSTGAVRQVDPKDQRIQVLREQLDHERWVNRVQREQDFYRTYWTRPVVVYHDPYNSYFWWWLLDQDAQTRALWYYNHQQVVDQARYQELLNRDATLEARLRQLEAQGAPRNPAAVPPGVPSPDLVYTDGYVNAAYNPQPPPAPVYVPPPVRPPVVVYHHPVVSFWHGVRVLLYALVVIAILALMVWLVFFKRWGATAA